MNIDNLQQAIPDGYIIRNDGMFGEWNLWLDDALGTIIGNGYESKDAAIQTAWQHKNQSKGIHNGLLSNPSAASV